MLPYTDDSDILTGDERLREIAGLLAAGILRLRCRAALPPAPAATPDPENPPNSSLNCLEVPRESRLNVHTG
jgi:hypothetical protein